MPGREAVRLIVLCDGTWQKRQVVRSKLAGGAPTSSEGAWFTNVALLSRAIASGSSDANVGTAPVVAEAEKKQEAAEAKSSTLNQEGASNFNIQDEEEEKSREKAKIERESRGDHMRQICFYQSGVGTNLGIASNLIEGGTGLGLVEKVEEAYGWLADNYCPGDEIFIFGFSRGAYTARCVAGFINWCGFIPKAFSGAIPLIFRAYQGRDPKDIGSNEKAAKVLYKYTGQWPSSDATATASVSSELEKLNGMSPEEISGFKDELSKLDKKEIEKMKDEKSSTLRMKFREPKVEPPNLRVVAVFDTVGALGVPGRFQAKEVEDFVSFFDPGLAPNVDFAFHALSLLEDRQDFLPTLWYQPRNRQEERAKLGLKDQVLKQVWFGGSHSDVGGGWPSHGLSDVSLAWLVSQLLDSRDGPLLRIDLDVVKQSQDRRREWAKQPQHPSRGLFQLKATRQVYHNLYQTKDLNDVVWKNALEDGVSNETLHHSVTVSGNYDPETSENFEELKKNDPDLLKRLWSEASSEDSLGRTEKLLRWESPDPTFSGGTPTDEDTLAKDSEAKSKQLFSLSVFGGGLKRALTALAKVAIGPIYQVTSDKRTLNDPNLKPSLIKSLNSKLRDLLGRDEKRADKR